MLPNERLEIGDAPCAATVDARTAARIAEQVKVGIMKGGDGDPAPCIKDCGCRPGEGEHIVVSAHVLNAIPTHG